MGKQIPLEVTQGLTSGGSAERPFYAPEDLPVEQRGGVPEEVWETNRIAANGFGFDVPTDNKKSGTVDPATQPNVPDDFTKREQARAAALGEQKLAGEREAGNTVEQQFDRRDEIVRESAKQSKANEQRKGGSK